MLHVFFGAVPNSQWSQKKIHFLDFITLHFIFIELSVPNMKNKSVKNFRNRFMIGALRKPLLLLKEPYFSVPKLPTFLLGLKILIHAQVANQKKISKNNNLEHLNGCTKYI